MPDDTVLKVAYTLYQEAGVLGLPGLYAVAYVMLWRMERVPGGAWEDMLAGTGPFRALGGWSAYRRAVADGWLDTLLTEWREDVQARLDEQMRSGARLKPLPAPYEIARLMVLGGIRKEGLAWIAEDDVGLHLTGYLLYCMSGDDVREHGWPPGEVVVQRGRWELHLYSRWPGDGR